MLFEGGGRGPKLRNAGGPWKVGKQGKSLSRNLQEEPALPTPRLEPSEADFGLLTARTVREEICIVMRQ